MERLADQQGQQDQIGRKGERSLAVKVVCTQAVELSVFKKITTVLAIDVARGTLIDYIIYKCGELATHRSRIQSNKNREGEIKRERRSFRKKKASQTVYRVPQCVPQIVYLRTRYGGEGAESFLVFFQ